MIDLLFKPHINLVEVFLIVVIAEWIFPVLGLWSIPILLFLFYLTDKVERAIWKVEKHDCQNN